MNLLKCENLATEDDSVLMFDDCLFTKKTDSKHFSLSCHSVFVSYIKKSHISFQNKIMMLNK